MCFNQQNLILPQAHNKFNILLFSSYPFTPFKQGDRLEGDTVHLIACGYIGSGF